MHIIPVTWKHRGGNKLIIKTRKKKKTYSEMLFMLFICERERRELEVIIYSEQRYYVHADRY